MRTGASVAKSKSAARKKAKRTTAAQHKVKSLRLPPDLAERIDRWARAMGKDSRSEAMRHLLEIGLSAPKRKSKGR
jgi:metal-responsive CopG/Arc/MetJ family transcriptional regulator